MEEPVASEAQGTQAPRADKGAAAQAPSLESRYRRHREAVLSALFTAAWMLAAHAYRWFNATSASHDGLAFYSSQGEALHQVGLGRFLEPVYTALRGGLAAPYLVGILATVFLAVAVALVVKLLHVRHAAVICAVAGALCTSISVTLLNASYTNWLDADMLALLLAVVAVCCCVRWRRGFVAGGVALMASMALYQAYLPVFLGLALIVLMADAVDAEPAAALGRRSLAFLGALVIGGALYFLCMKAAIAVTAAPVVNEYNSLGGAADFSGVSLPRLVAGAYLLPVAYLVTPETHGMYFAGVLNVAVALAGIAGLVTLARRNRPGKVPVAVLVACVALMPLAVNAVYVVSHGMVHGLMIHAYSLFYVGVAVMANRLLRMRCHPVDADGAQKDVPRFAKPLAVGMVAATLAVSACNAVYANDLYVVKDLQAQATLSQMTRIADRLDAVEGYAPGQTQVVFVGSPGESAGPIADGAVPNHGRALLQSLTGQVRFTGFYGERSVTYLQTYELYFNYVLGEPIVVADEATAERYAALPEVQEIPGYPSPDCCAWVDGRVVVKLGEPAVE